MLISDLYFFYIKYTMYILSAFHFGITQFVGPVVGFVCLLHLDYLNVLLYCISVGRAFGTRILYISVCTILYIFILFYCDWCVACCCSHMCACVSYCYIRYWVSTILLPKIKTMPDFTIIHIFFESKSSMAFGNFI